MLTLTRRAGEGIFIGSEVEIVVLGISGGRVRIGIRAPRDLPVYRRELVERIKAENRRAMSSAIPHAIVRDASIHFEAGLFGMGKLRQFVLCDVAEDSSFRAMVSCDDPNVQLLVLDALELMPDYPIENARRAAGLGDEEIAVAAVATAPADGSQVTVNMMAPLVVGLESRRGVQVILDRDDLGVAHPIVSAEDKEDEAPLAAAGGGR